MLLSAQIVISALAALALLQVPGASASLGHHQNRPGLAKIHQKHRPVGEARDVEQQPSNLTQGSGLEKRQRRIAHFSWYDTEESGNPGHCGEMIRNYEFVVARKYSEFTTADCGKQIRIFYKGKTAVATIKDSCPGCWDGGFDMSRGLFEFFEWDAVRVGVLDTEWEWVGGPEAVPPPPPPPPTTTTTQWEAPWTPSPSPSSTSVWQQPSSTWVPPSSSSVWSSSATSSSRSSASSSSSSSSAGQSGSGSASSGSIRPTASASSDFANTTGPQNLRNLSAVMVKMSFLIADGAASV